MRGLSSRVEGGPNRSPHAVREVQQGVKRAESAAGLRGCAAPAAEGRPSAALQRWRLRCAHVTVQGLDLPGSINPDPQQPNTLGYRAFTIFPLPACPALPYSLPRERVLCYALSPTSPANMHLTQFHLTSPHAPYPALPTTTIPLCTHPPPPSRHCMMPPRHLRQVHLRPACRRGHQQAARE